MIQTTFKSNEKARNYFLEEGVDVFVDVLNFEITGDE